MRNFIASYRAGSFRGLKKIKGAYRVHFDASSRSKETILGAVIISPQGIPLYLASMRVHSETGSVFGEVMAGLFAADIARDKLGKLPYVLIGDNQVALRFLGGKDRVGGELKPLAGMRSKLGGCKIAYLPRQLNRIADQVCREASKAPFNKIVWHRDFDPYYLLVPTPGGLLEIPNMP